jgi:hypothetical protein
MICMSINGIYENAFLLCIFIDVLPNNWYDFFREKWVPVFCALYGMNKNFYIGHRNAFGSKY